MDLYEKERLGGQFNLAWLPPGKAALKDLLVYYQEEIKSRGINIISKETDENDLLRRDYDEVVLATGAEPFMPAIKGLKDYFWTEFLKDENLPEGKKVLIIGGGLIGIEVASKLVEKKNEVVIVEMLDEIARGMEMIEKKMTLKKLEKFGAKIYTHSVVREIDGRRVRIENDGVFYIENVDHVVLTTGMKSYNPLEEKLKGKIKYHLIGDARKVGKAQDAIRDGYFTALKV